MQLFVSLLLSSLLSTLSSTHSKSLLKWYPSKQTQSPLAPIKALLPQELHEFECLHVRQLGSH